MIEIVFLHLAQDRAAAKRFVAAWSEGRAISLEIVRGAPAPTFGSHVLVCGLVWTVGRDGADDRKALAECVRRTGTQGIMLVTQGARSLLSDEAPSCEIWESAGDTGVNIARLAALAADIRSARGLQDESPFVDARDDEAAEVPTGQRPKLRLIIGGRD